MTIGGYLAVRFERLLEGWLINESADSRRPTADSGSSTLLYAERSIAREYCALSPRARPLGR